MRYLTILLFLFLAMGATMPPLPVAPTNTVHQLPASFISHPPPTAPKLARVRWHEYRTLAVSDGFGGWTTNDYDATVTITFVPNKEKQFYRKPPEPVVWSTNVDVRDIHWEQYGPLSITLE